MVFLIYITCVCQDESHLPFYFRVTVVTFAKSPLSQFPCNETEWFYTIRSIQNSSTSLINVLSNKVSAQVLVELLC